MTAETIPQDTQRQTPAIEARGISHAYGETPALTEVNLTVRDGDFVALLGPNGGGKTTLLRILMGLLEPDHGEVRLFGRPPDKMRHAIGYVPQDTSHNKDFPISALDVVLMARLGNGSKGWSYSRKDRGLAAEMLDKVGLSALAGKPIGKLSGGERQRVFIARALVNQPRLLFLDEPTSSVDARWQTHLYDLLTELNKETTIILVSHDIGVISRAVKSVACVNQVLHQHDSPEITPEMLEQTYQCPVDLIAHGVPHRVFPAHQEHHPHD